MRIKEEFNLSQEKSKILYFINLILLAISLPLMSYFHILSNYPTSFLESQLSFDGDIIKSHFAIMSKQEINLYILSIIMDYFFIIAFNSIRLYLTIRLTNKLEVNSMIRKIGPFMAIFGIIGATCDCIENYFIILMVHDPLSFPNWWALAHSYFALTKYIIMFATITWLIFALFTNSIRKNRKET
ncbi:MAG: hypothetical protein GF353_15920 [Candidatus Lokiarchaeota archaeon]|nr:hypothetical protein [Candidatus Lokiarchaeota archaeon]